MTIKVYQALHNQSTRAQKRKDTEKNHPSRQNSENKNLNKNHPEKFFTSKASKKKKDSNFDYIVNSMTEESKKNRTQYLNLFANTQTKKATKKQDIPDNWENIDLPEAGDTLRKNTPKLK